MSRSRQCQIGDRVTTDWDKDRSGITEHVIVDRTEMQPTQSGIMFKIDPPLRLLSHSSWIDADWFEPLTNVTEEK